jgi:hypothetical protein
MKATIVPSRDVLAANRLDPEYFLTLAHLRAAQVEGVSLLDHLKQTITEEKARELVESLPCAPVAKLLLPLADPSDRHRSAEQLVTRVAKAHPYEALVRVFDDLDAMRAKAAQAVQKAQAAQEALEQVARTAPRRRRPH